VTDEHMKKLYCHVCGKHQPTLIVQEYETYPVKGVNTRILADVTCCELCGTQILNFEVDDENLKRAYKEAERISELKNM